MEEQLFTLPETNCTKLEDLIWVVGTTKFKPVFDRVFAFSDAKQAFLQVMPHCLPSKRQEAIGDKNELPNRSKRRGYVTQRN